MYWTANRMLLVDELVKRGYTQEDTNDFLKDGLRIVICEECFVYYPKGGTMILAFGYRDMLGINNDGIVVSTRRVALPA